MPRPFSDQERHLLRERLRRTARSRIEEVGIRATSVDDLSRRVGISKGAFYLLYESKEDLVVAVFSDVEEEVRASLDELVARGEGSPKERMTEFVRFVFESIDRHPLLTLLADSVEAPVLWRSVTPEEMAERMADDDRYFAGLAGVLHSEGVLDPTVSGEVVAGIPLLALAVARGRDLIGEERYNQLVGLVAEGLGSRLAREEA